MAAPRTSHGTVAVLMVDLQNDVVHAKGAYGRAGVTAAAVSAIPERLRPLLAQVRQRGGWIVATLFTLVPGRDCEPFVSDQLRTSRPFLGKGDFLPGTWGHALVEELGPADLSVEKVATSAFAMSRLDWVLRHAGIEQLYVAGVATHASVATTVRDAVKRDFSVAVLEDGCAAFDAEAHRTAIEELRTVATVTTVREAMQALR